MEILAVILWGVFAAALVYAIWKGVVSLRENGRIQDVFAFNAVDCCIAFAVISHRLITIVPGGIPGVIAAVIIGGLLSAAILTALSWIISKILPKKTSA